MRLHVFRISSCFLIWASLSTRDPFPRKAPAASAAPWPAFRQLPNGEPATSIEFLRAILANAAAGSVHNVVLPRGAHFDLDGEALVVNNGVTVVLTVDRNAPYASSATLDGNNMTRIFSVFGRLEVHDVRMQFGMGTTFGGCVLVSKRRLSNLL